MAATVVNIFENDSTRNVNIIDKSSSINVEVVDNISPTSVEVVVSGGIVNYAPGADGVGISSISDNGDGTFTIYLTNSTQFTTPDFTGPQGEQGIQGETGTVAALSSVPDVSISNLQDGDYLKYNSSSSAWVNKQDSYRHNQNNASTTWSVTHNLGLQDYLPNISIKLSGGGTYNNVQTMGIVNYVNENELTINLIKAESGYAYIKI